MQSAQQPAPKERPDLGTASSGRYRRLLMLRHISRPGQRPPWYWLDSLYYLQLLYCRITTPHDSPVSVQDLYCHPQHRTLLLLLLGNTHPLHMAGSVCDSG